MAIVYLDFEFNSTQNPALNVICVSLLAVKAEVATTHNFWLQTESERDKFRELVESLIADEYIFCAYHVPAEASSLLSLNIDPRRMRWIDLAIEYRMLLNQNEFLSTGRQIINGEVKYISPVVADAKYRNSEVTSKTPTNLVACVYKLIGVRLDSKHKDEMRDLILSKNSFTDSERKAIMLYCDSDVKYLPEVLKSIVNHYGALYLPKDRKNLKQEMFLRGEYAARTAIMEREGYPINYKAARKFADSVDPFVFELQETLARNFPSIAPFELDRKHGTFTQKKKNIQAWVEAQDFKSWRKTEKGSIQVSLDAFEEQKFSSKSDQTIFGNAFVKYLKTLQSLNGFRPKKGSSTIFESIGFDSRVRPWFGIYGSQTSRSQPKATSYLLLKAKWMRALIAPKPGKAIVGIDYSQQEFLIAGLLSQDKNMIEAYQSGDVYFHTGKLDGAIPWDGKKEDYTDLREQFKSTVLGIQYGMGKYSLATKIERDTGKPCSPDKAQEMIYSFDASYPDYAVFRKYIRIKYFDQGYLKLPCGWTMFGDNKNERSISNFPIQGIGASIMRKAVALAQDNFLNVILTLHDAIYVECDVEDIEETVNKLGQAMHEGFQHYFLGTSMQEYAHCRIDPMVFGPSLQDREFETQLGKVTASELYLSSRAENDYNLYKKFLE